MCGSGDRLNVRALFVRLTRLPAHAPLPDALTLTYLDGSRIVSFTALRRVVPAVRVSGEAIYAVRERVRAVDSLRFEVYVADRRAIKGIFKKSEGQNWKLECECVLESDAACLGSSAEAEVCVAVEGHAARIDRAVMAAVKTRTRRLGFTPLEAIPEECGSDGGCFSIDDWECVSDGVDSNEWCDVDGDEVDLEMAMEGVSWAVDVGLRVMCVGVGSVVSKSSLKTLRRLRLL